MRKISMQAAGDPKQDESRPLTDRELEILGLLAAGSSTAAIAKDLSISPTTVRNHVQRILTKLQVHSRLAAVARGYSKGLIVWDAGPRKRRIETSERSSRKD
jgi:DNA-binding NarL/FixJ family response regulator